MQAIISYYNAEENEADFLCEVKNIKKYYINYEFSEDKNIFSSIFDSGLPLDPPIVGHLRGNYNYDALLDSMDYGILNQMKSIALIINHPANELTTENYLGFRSKFIGIIVNHLTQSLTIDTSNKERIFFLLPRIFKTNKNSNTAPQT